MNTLGKPDIDAREHFGLVGHVSKRYANLQRGERIEDTEEFADGLVGLTRAIDNFDPTKGFQFSTFAFYCIRNEICKGMKERQRGVVHASIRIDWTNSEIDMPARANEEPSFVKAGRLVDALLNKLPEDTEPRRKNKRILVDYYLRERMLKEIGGELGVTRERIRQRREQALEELKRIAGSMYVKKRGNYGKKEQAAQKQAEVQQVGVARD